MFPYDPGLYSFCYPSSVVSPWYVWFCEMGYPELDIRKFDDAEWAIIHYLNSPLIPSEYRWQWAFQGFQNMEITFDTLRKFVLSIDVTKKEFWDREEKRSEEIGRETDRREAHQQDIVTRAANAIMHNRGLIERVMKEGLRAIDLAHIRRHIPNYRF